MSQEWMSAAQAAAALGVKPATLYAYVSRGVISREVTVVDGQRASRFKRADVLQLARARARPQAGAWSVFIESDVTALDAVGGLAFRGVDVARCVEWGFEATVQHVLGGLGELQIIPGARLRPLASRRSDAIRHAVLTLAEADPDRADISPQHCRAVALAAIKASTAALTGVVGSTSAQALASAWSPGRASASTGVIDVALSVLVDHELTASTLAARAAAGVRTDPWMVLLTGLSAMSGPFQAGASQRALRVLREWQDGTAPATGRVPGFGHKVYVGPDPRAELLLQALQDVAPTTCDLVESLAVYVARCSGAYPNIDLALAAIIQALGLPDDAGEAIFTLARIGGLMAHAMEEYPQGLRLRPRALS
ncbi:citrate/2-methylcitrate synthase [Micromonospora chersina]|uniref:citrate/2-methylcitrate synthase n=1 Tax=Micromonospora chersina TaxID=47854 RepID=UPI0033B70DEC